MEGNLWSVFNYNGLATLIKSSGGKFFILAIVLKNTNSTIKIKIRKFIKSKSLNYPNMLFIYYEISSIDEEQKITKTFSNDTFTITEKNYPLMFHMCNYNNVLININNVSVEYMTKSFDVMKEKYDEDKERWITYQKKLKEKEDLEKYEKVKTKIKEPEIKEPEIKEPEIKEPEIKEPEIKEPEIKEPDNEKPDEPEEPKEKKLSQNDVIEDNKRMIDKLILLKSKSNKYQIDFMSDIQKRKEKEELDKKAINDAEKEKIKKIVKEQHDKISKKN
jgi:hypothetical protein